MVFPEIIHSKSTIFWSVKLKQHHFRVIKLHVSHVDALKIIFCVSKITNLHRCKFRLRSILRKAKNWRRSWQILLSGWESIFLLLYQGLHFGAFWPPHPVPSQMPSIFSLSNMYLSQKNIWFLICFQLVPCSNITRPTTPSIPTPPCLKRVRIMLESWNLAGKYTPWCSFRKYNS